MVSFTKAMASDYAKRGIRVNAVSPGVIHTPMSYVEMKDFDQRLDEFNKAHPLGRVGKPIDVARAVLYFSCDDSDWITGQNLIVDGGWLLRD
jgi:NAD(P)-dependent dehydrogenase (short-subunit alcohol dehydrogenase family)